MNMKYFLAGIVFLASANVFAQFSTPNGNGTIHYEGGNVGIGIVSPTANLHVAGGDGFKLERSSKVMLFNANYSAANVHSDISTSPGMGFRISTNGNNANSNPQFVIKSSGSVGIGTKSPTANLHVAGGDGFKLERSSKVMLFNANYSAANVHSDISTSPGMGFRISTNGNNANSNPQFVIKSSGDVGIGTIVPDAKLTVAGKVHAQEVKVTVDAGADFVFESNYHLISLDELENYVTVNKHLPEIASAKEMETQGIHLAEMNIKLLQKIEELTLHLINQNRQLQEQQHEIAQMKTQIESLDQQ